MKKTFLSLMSLSFVLVLTSCRVEIHEDNHIPVGGNTPGTSVQNGVLPQGGTLSGTITKDLTIEAGNYKISGVVQVVSGVTLTIKAGANFVAESSAGTSLVILQGGKIDAQGTANQPIVFTSDNKKPGDWGGITLYGNAPILASNGAKTAKSEDGNNRTYGGENPSDNSGVMKFVRVEYAGRKIGDGSSETNTFTFYAVGSGTILENLVAYKGTDDGLEFFGGTASVKNFVAYGNFDDSFDWQDAWSGQDNMNWYAFQTKTGNFAMEIEASSNENNTPPKIANITLIREEGTKPEVSGSAEISAIQFKKQGSGIFTNIFIDGYQDTDGKQAFPILIQDKSTEEKQLNTGKIELKTLNVTTRNSNANTYGYAYTQPNPKTITNDNKATKVKLESGNWAMVDGVDLLKELK